MDIVQFFTELFAKYDKEAKCGFCWKFGAPLSLEGLNKSITPQEDVCCMQAYLTEYEQRTEYQYNGQTGLNNYQACIHDFTLYVGTQVDDIGTNVHTEIPEHPISESLWATIFKPLLDCLGCGKELYLCELGYDFDITKWQMKKVQFLGDKNFTGWMIKGTFRIKIN